MAPFEGRKAAFERLCRDNYRRVLAFFRSKPSVARNAEDLTQEVFLLAFRSYDDYRGESSEAAWLFGIAHNVFLQDLRRRNAAKRKANEVSLDRPASDLDGDPLQPAALDPSSEEELEAREAQDRIASAMRKLPHQQRICMTMRKDGVSYESIAEILGLAPGTVKSHIFRARAKLKREFDGESRGKDV